MTEVEAIEAANAGWAETGKDLFSGGAGGIAQVLIGEPHSLSMRPRFVSRLVPNRVQLTT